MSVEAPQFDESQRVQDPEKAHVEHNASHHFRRGALDLEEYAQMTEGDDESESYRRGAARLHAEADHKAKEAGKNYDKERAAAEAAKRELDGHDDDVE